MKTIKYKFGSDEDELCKLRVQVACATFRQHLYYLLTGKLDVPVIGVRSENNH